MFKIINDKDNSVYKTANTRDEAFDILGELIVKFIPGHVVNED